MSNRRASDAPRRESRDLVSREVTRPATVRRRACSALFLGAALSFGCSDGGTGVVEDLVETHPLGLTIGGICPEEVLTNGMGIVALLDCPRLSNGETTQSNEMSVVLWGTFGLKATCAEHNGLLGRWVNESTQQTGALSMNIEDTLLGCAATFFTVPAVELGSGANVISVTGTQGGAMDTASVTVMH